MNNMDKNTKILDRLIGGLSVNLEQEVVRLHANMQDSLKDDSDISEKEVLTHVFQIYNLAILLKSECMDYIIQKDTKESQALELAVKGTLFTMDEIIKDLTGKSIKELLELQKKLDSN